MKRIILIAALFPLFSFAQKSEVVNDSSESKSVIYSKSLIWITNTWKSPNHVINLQDEASGTIIVKGGMASVPHSLGIPADGQTMTQITIMVKDGKAKIEFDNTYFKWTGANITWRMEDTGGNNQKKKWQALVLKEMDDLILSYKTSLLKKLDDF